MTTTTVATDTHKGAPSAQVQRAAGRYQARHFLWDLAPATGTDPLPAVRKCGRVSRVAGGVEVKVSTAADGTRTPGFSGLSSCGSVWACPVCSAKIAAERQGEIERALRAWHEQGGRVALATFTMKHRKGQALASLWDGYADAWHAASSGAGWKADQQLWGQPFAREVKTGKRAGQTVVELRIPTIRVVEVTEGKNGWHVHVHVILFLAGDARHAEVEKLGASMFSRWSRSLESNGFDAPKGDPVWDAKKGEYVTPGYDCKLVTGDPCAALGDYFTKAVYSASMEAARGDLKDAKNGNRTPFAILRGLVGAAAGDADFAGEVDEKADLGAWREWERSSKKRRQIAWSQGLRKLLLPDEVEKSDQEIAEEAAGGEVVDVIEKGAWVQIARARADWQLLSAFRRSNVEGWELVAWFTQKARQAESEDAARRASWRSRT